MDCSFKATINSNRQSGQICKGSQKETRRTRYWPTAGAFCIDLVLNENKIKELYLFGIDNYTTLTLVLYKQQEFTDVYENSGTKMAFYHLKEMIKEFPDIQFYSAAKSKKFKWDFSNWNLI